MSATTKATGELDSMLPSLSSLFSRQELWVASLGLAALLAIFWILRGSPPGQSVAVEDDKNAPSPGQSDRLVTGVAVGLGT